MRLLGHPFFILFASVLLLGADGLHVPSSSSTQRQIDEYNRRQSPDGQHCEVTGGQATQYWDCCKVGAAWPGKNVVVRPAHSCAKDGLTRLEDPMTTSGSEGGSAFACNSQQPFVSSSNPMLSYAVGARPIALGEDSFFGACYSMQFQELPGKTLVFQAINSGDMGDHRQIDIQTPGGTAAASFQLSSSLAANGYVPYRDIQAQSLPLYGTGVLTLTEPSAGFTQRFDWLIPPDHPYGLNPTISSMCRVKCPKILTDNTGTIRYDDGNYSEAPQ
ncbi:unnamed protein product [Tilletia laevis]|nr:unnamed protein product [Tilletia laevis]